MRYRFEFEKYIFNFAAPREGPLRDNEKNMKKKTNTANETQQSNQKIFFFLLLVCRLSLKVSGVKVTQGILLLMMCSSQ